MEGELRAALECGEGTPDGSINIEVAKCLRRIQRSTKFLDGEQDLSESVLLCDNWLEEDLKMSESQTEQKIFSENSCGSLKAAATNGGEGPLCKEEELHMQPFTAGDPEKGLRAKLKQEPEWETEQFDHALPLLGSVDQGLELHSGIVMEEQGWRGGRARVKESFDGSAEAESTSGAAAAKAAVGPLCKEEEELHMQSCLGDPEKWLQVEVKQEQEGEPLTPGCDKTFSQQHLLQADESIQTGQKPHVCTDCGKRFLFKSYLKIHQRVHTREKPHRCDECGNSFSHLHHLKNHQRVHTGEKPHSCDDCGKTFAQLSNLKAHHRVHTGAKPYSCDECGEGFAQPCHLKNHRMIHTGEKPYSCDECGKSFAHLFNFKNHQMIHTGEKPYSCDECGKSYAQLSNLKTHQRLHTGEKPHSCDECGKCFAHLCNLKTHRRVHTGEKPFSCTLCGKRFSQSSNLQKHMLAHS